MPRSRRPKTALTATSTRGHSLTTATHPANELAQSHEMPADEWTYYAYDTKGNCTAIQEPTGTTYFEYTDASVVSSIKYPGGTANYFYYDANLRRYAIEDSDGLT